jgi:uncharacterized membrane-anchored protein YitT (DUF2179 family)
MEKGFLEKTKEFLLINLGLLFVALGIFFFKVPNHFATGGVSGLAIILGHFFQQLSTGPIMMIINAVLLIAGFIFIGFDFASKTVYSSFALSGMVWLLEKICPISGPLTGDTFLELMFAILLPAVGSAIVFNQNASTGGTDIIAKILNKHMHINIGKTLLMADFSITLAACAVFGIKTGMYSILGLFMKGFLIDVVIESMNISKQMVIISSRPEEIKSHIINELHRGATIHRAKGAYTDEEKEVITTIVNRRQAIALRMFIRELDKKAFISITNASEIVGKGFRASDI